MVLDNSVRSQARAIIQLDLNSGKPISIIFSCCCVLNDYNFLGTTRKFAYLCMIFSAIIFMQLGLKQSRRNHDNEMETLVSPIPPIERVVSLDNSKDTSKATRG